MSADENTQKVFQLSMKNTTSDSVTTHEVMISYRQEHRRAGPTLVCLICWHKGQLWDIKFEIKRHTYRKSDKVNFKNLISHHKQALKVESEIFTIAFKSVKLICNFDKKIKLKWDITKNYSFQNNVPCLTNVSCHDKQFFQVWCW